jgi:hypothetical protein
MKVEEVGLFELRQGDNKIMGFITDGQFDDNINLFRGIFYPTKVVDKTNLKINPKMFKFRVLYTYDKKISNLNQSIRQTQYKSKKSKKRVNILSYFIRGDVFIYSINQIMDYYHGSNLLCWEVVLKSDNFQREFFYGKQNKKLNLILKKLK